MDRDSRTLSIFGTANRDNPYEHLVCCRLLAKIHVKLRWSFMWDPLADARRSV